MKKIAKTINDGRIFQPVINDPLNHVVEIIDLPDPEHKKTTFPYVEPTVQLPDEIEDVLEPSSFETKWFLVGGKGLSKRWHERNNWH